MIARGLRLTLHLGSRIVHLDLMTGLGEGMAFAYVIAAGPHAALQWQAAQKSALAPRGRITGHGPRRSSTPHACLDRAYALATGARRHARRSLAPGSR